jgi:regulator of sigma E protease
LAFTLNNIWVFVVVLGGMVVLHEFGHFIVARFFGIRVETFSVGFGPRLWGFKRGNTDYRLSLVPLGGYVKMAGENLDEQLTGAPDEFMSKPKWQRFCVAIAGPTANILTALAIPMAIAMIHLEVPAFFSHAPVINGIDPGSPAEKAGLLPGDQIVSIGGQPTPTWRDALERIGLSADMEQTVFVKRGEESKTLALHVEAEPASTEKIGYAGVSPDLGPDSKITVVGVDPGSAAESSGLKEGDQVLAVNGKTLPQNDSGIRTSRRTIQESNGQPVTLTVQRNGEVLTLTAVPQLINNEYRLGYYQTYRGAEITVTRLGPIAAFNYSVAENMRIIRITKSVLGDVFSGNRKFSDAVSGPVGIFVVTGQAAEAGPGAVFGLMGMLSLSLGLINLFPIPVLDGGLIFMLVLESILGLFGLPLTLKAKERMMQVGFVAIVLLMAFVIYNDVAKLIPSRSAPQPADSRPAGSK